MNTLNIKRTLLAILFYGSLAIPFIGHTKNVTSEVIPNPLAIDKDTARYTRQNLRNHFRSLEEHCNGCGVRLVKLSEQAQRAASIINRLLEGSDINQSFDVYSVDFGPQVSAFTVGGSVIAVSDELIKRVTSDEQLAAILGHEIAHSLAEHQLDNSHDKRQKGLSSGIMLLNLAVIAYTGVPLVGDLAEAGAGKLGTGFILKYKRAQEYEADRIGMLLMANAGYAPDSALNLWKNADMIFGSTSSGGFFSTHPSNKKRFKKLEDNLPAAQTLFNKSSR